MRANKHPYRPPLTHSQPLGPPVGHSPTLKHEPIFTAARLLAALLLSRFNVVLNVVTLP
jgi:hypothetical protein